MVKKFIYFLVLSAICATAWSASAQDTFNIYLPIIIGPLPAPLPQGQELANAYAGIYSGLTVMVTGPFQGEEEDYFNQSVAPFEQETGIDIVYSFLDGFEANIIDEIENPRHADVVSFPQPGILRKTVELGLATDIDTLVNPAWIDQNYNQSWIDSSKMTSPSGIITAGIWARINPKSMVFYPKAKFDAAGYSVPSTWDDMMALTEEIAADGDTAWCIGIESGPASGWPMTDWIEDVLLRTAPVADYDDWVNGDILFNSPQINTALDTIEEIWFNDAYVYGGQAAIPTTHFGDAISPMFDDPPGCWLHRQASFIANFIPSELEPGVDYDVFYLPPIESTYGSPVLGAGHIYGVFNDRPEVRAVIQYFTTAESHKIWAQEGGIILPHNDALEIWYDDPISQKQYDILQNATTFRFDGSDMMPSVVMDPFWQNMTDYVAGTISREDALDAIDASWP